MIHSFREFLFWFQSLDKFKNSTFNNTLILLTVFSQVAVNWKSSKSSDRIIWIDQSQDNEYQITYLIILIGQFEPRILSSGIQVERNGSPDYRKYY